MTRPIAICSSYIVPIALVLLMIMSTNVVQGKIGAALFAFGDSFYDTGVTNYLSTATMHANIPPYGLTYFIKPTGRFCDGRLIPDFIAQRAHLPFLPPFLQPGLPSYRKGVAFASAAAGALNETFRGKTVSLDTQVVSFKKMTVKLRRQFGHGNSKAMISKAVYLFNIGTNDYLFALQTNPAALTPQYVNLVVGNITMAIKEIYRLGGRKFVINNVGPVGCFPVVKAAVNSSTCFGPVSQIASLHNLILSQALPALAIEYTDFKYGLFDMYTNLNKRITNPSVYGFKESNSACCGSGAFRGIFSCGGQGNLTKYELCLNPREYLFWDSVHFSQKTNSQLANLIWSGTSHDIGPYNAKALFDL